MTPFKMPRVTSFLILICTFVCVCLGKLELGNVLSYKGMEYSHYSPWSLRGELTFIFKTTRRDGLLAYQDDGRHSFIEVFLVDGNVRFKACMGGCQADHEIFIRRRFDDGFWHKLRIKREQRNCTITVDEKIAWVPCGVRKNDRFKYYKNYLYIANFNPMMSLNNLVFPGAFHEGLYYRFQGCIGDVRYSNYKGKLIEAALKQTNGDKGCTNACAAPNVNQCQNKGKCMDEIGHVVCDCVATGYEGPLCTIPNDSLRHSYVSVSSSVYLNGSGYILYDVGNHQPGRSTAANHIAFRFATTSQSGVMVFTDIADDHVIVELINGFLRVSWDLGQGGLVLMSRQGCLNDAVWHSVVISRVQRRVKITIDNQRPIHSAIPGRFSFLDFKGGREQIVFGGGPLTRAFNRSLSRTNFTGFLQQFQFDEFDVIDETILGKAFTLLGNGVLNDSSLFHIIPSSPSPLVNCSREVDPKRERLCDDEDDEDLCGPSSVSSGDGPLVSDCETTGSCSTEPPNQQQRTDTPSFVEISANKNLSLSNVTSPNKTLHNMTSRIQPSPSRSMYVAQTSETTSSHESSLLSKTTRGISTTDKFNVKPTNPVIHKEDISTRSSISPSLSLVSIDTKTALTNKTIAPSVSLIITGQENGTLELPTTSASANVDNSTILAYRNTADIYTGGPTWLVGLLVTVMLDYYS